MGTYSWGLLFWSCLSLLTPYADMGRNEHFKEVCVLGKRPELPKDWPKSIRYLIRKAWAYDQRNRFTMKEVCSHLERIEIELNQDLNFSSVKSSFRFFLPATSVKRRNITVVSKAA